MSDRPTRTQLIIARTLKKAEFPDLKAILCQVVKRMGGPKGIAKIMLQEFETAKPGSMQRAMLLQMVMQGAKSVSAKENARDIGLISDDDLETEMLRLIGKLHGPTSGTDSGGEPAANGDKAQEAASDQ
jgi:hypothetical protein